MYCPNCNKKVEGNQKFCPECGSPIQVPSENNPNSSSPKSSLIIVIILVVIVLFVLIFLLLNKKENKAESTSNSNTNSVSNVSNSASNTSTNTNSNTNTNTNTNTSTNTNKNTNSNSNQVPQNLTCTQNLSDQYGTYYVTHDYTFKNNQLSSYKMKLVANLNKNSYKYRDTLINSYDQAYSQYKQVSGIKIYNTKRNDGFDYYIEIADSKKVDKEKLKSMNLYLINYSGIKMEAYKTGATCK